MQANALSTVSVIGARTLMSCACRHPSIAVLVATHLVFCLRQNPRLFALLASGKSPFFSTHMQQKELVFTEH